MIKPNFYKELNQLIGFNISIITNNHNVHNGFLLDVKNDFLVIQMNQAKECYFNLNQIYAVSKNTRDFKSKVFDYNSTQKQTFIELLNELKHQWVTVNGDSILSFEGLLGTVTDNYIELFNKDKQSYIQLPNIHYILKGINKRESSENKQQENREGKTDNKQSEANQGKEFNAELKEENDALDLKVNEESAATLEKSEHREFLPEVKEEPPVQSEIAKDQEVLSEANQGKGHNAELKDALDSKVNEESAATLEKSEHREFLPEVKEEPPVQSEIAKDQEVLSEANQGKGHNAELKDALDSKVNEELAATLEKSEHQEVLPEVKEEPPVQSEIAKDQEVLSEANQGKGFNAELKDALDSKVNEESAAHLEKSEHQEVLPEVKEEPSVQSEIAKDQEILLEVNQGLEVLSQLIAEPVTREGKSGHHGVSPGFEQPATRSKEHKADKYQAETIEDTAEYKEQKSTEKKKKNIEVSKKEFTSAINKKDIQSVIQENQAEESLNSIPQEPDKELPEKHDSKEKRAMIIQTLMKSSEKMFTENRMQESQFSSLMKYAQIIHRRKDKRVKP
ncbi:DUF2642 domain-containing protein [Peribacillus sp. B-H-3]|uniref:DUF2642 domain-containing protein n=1 Tax=Peribacillus sp. B-H-3 TaxID=3400420 RepID=UPI003B0284B6